MIGITIQKISQQNAAIKLSLQNLVILFVQTSILQTSNTKPVSTNLIALQMFRSFLMRVIPPEVLQCFKKLTSRFFIMVKTTYYKLRLTPTQKIWMCLLQPLVFQFLPQ